MTKVSAAKRLALIQRAAATVGLFAVISCASTTPTKIGADTFYSSRTNTAGIFGDVTAVAGALMVEGNQFCEGMGKQFELVTQTMNPTIAAVRMGGASITFKCVDKAQSPVMRPDNGVTTITR